MSAVLQRETFQISRLMEFFTERELTAQMGFGPDRWPVALLKELMDNALDAAESSGVAPEITVTLQPDALIVQDNGPGLPLEVIERSLDYSIRVSDKTGYVSPTRGQQGNALKCLWAAPFVVTGTGQIDIETDGQRYQVQVTLDRIAQRPQVDLVHLGDSDVKTGTRITLHWNEIASYQNNSETPSFYSVVAGFAALNPHLTLTAGKHTWCATDPGWTHWRPDRPTSPHWYNHDHLRNLMALLLDADRRTDGRTRSINEFVRQFSGLTGTNKAAVVARAAGLHSAMLSDLINGDDLDLTKVAALLSAMQQEAKPVRPEALGVIGEDHCRQTLQSYGINSDSIGYRIAKGTTVDGLPYVIEVAFGVRSEARGRRLITGVNFSPSFQPPFTALDDALNAAQINYDDPVAMIIHLVCPRVEYTDRGKTHALLPVPISEALAKLVKSAAKRWTEAKRRADREGRIRESDRQALLKAEKAKEMTVKEAAYQVMVQAYLEASDGTRLATARQIMYKARPKVIQLTGNAQPWKRSSYFTQTLLPDFLEEHPDLCADWDVTFDDRGHFAEPHTSLRIGCGTLAVRTYINGWHRRIGNGLDNAQLAMRLKTSGPTLRYRHVLFIEKEGFTALLRQAQIMERYDIALLSTKGLSVTAARRLVESLSQHGVTILVLHDFDESGFKIIHTLKTNTRRYHFKTPPNVVDIGVRLADVQAMDLPAEDVEYNRKDDPRPFLVSRGATKEEAAFLVRGQRPDGRWLGQRVEIDAMSSQQFIHWLERKFEEHGVGKFIPDEKALQDAWTRAWRIRKLNHALARTIKETTTLPAIPPNLRNRVEQYLKEHPAIPWDMALAALEEQHE